MRTTQKRLMMRELKKNASIWHEKLIPGYPTRTTQVTEYTESVRSTIHI